MPNEEVIMSTDPMFSIWYLFFLQRVGPVVGKTGVGRAKLSLEFIYFYFGGYQLWIHYLRNWVPCKAPFWGLLIAELRIPENFISSFRVGFKTELFAGEWTENRKCLMHYSGGCDSMSYLGTLHNERLAKRPYLLTTGPWYLCVAKNGHPFSAYYVRQRNFRTAYRFQLSPQLCSSHVPYPNAIPSI